jgi:predicted PurR-regulated permease PerM
MEKTPKLGASHRTQALAIIIALGLAIIVAVAPFIPGLLGAPVLAVIFAPLHRRLMPRFKPGLAAVLVLLVALLGVLLPAIGISILVISELPDAVMGPGMQSIMAHVATLHVGSFAVGTELAKAGGSIAAWASAQMVGIAGAAGRAVINLVIAMLGLYYLLLADASMWESVARHLPFSRASADRLRDRFVSITEATLLGIGATAALQGVLVGVAFALVGLSHPVLWGSVAAVASVLPVVGGSLVWVPGAIVLALENEMGAAVALALIGVVIISNIDNVVRPIIFKQVSDIHPLITLVGCFAGVEYFGLTGVLLGPLALAYFIELIGAFNSDYGDIDAEPAAS